VKPEEKARQEIDQLLEKAGWQIQDYRELNLGASLGVAVREFPLNSGFIESLLFVENPCESVLVAEGNIEERVIPH